MAEIKNENKQPARPEDSHLEDKATGTRLGVPAGAAKEESPGGYGGTDRLQSEVGPLHPDAGLEQARDI